MNGTQLLESLLYLDRDFISSYYEIISGEPATTHFTRQEGKKAGAQLPLFSGELSAVETRSYGISSIKMLEKTFVSLQGYPEINSEELKPHTTSTYCWVNGDLSSAVSKSTIKKPNGEDVEVGQESYFILYGSESNKFALVTAETNFSPGIASLARLQTTILKEMSIPVRTFMRILSPRTHYEHWVAVPLVIFERPHVG